MRNFERTVLIQAMCVTLFATGAVAACSTTNPSDSPGDDAGVPLDEAGRPLVDGSIATDGAVADGAQPATKCTKNSECPSGVCNIAKGTCDPASCKDGTKNGTETDTDCGGSDCPKCDMQKTCKVATDCASAVCKDAGMGLKCQAAACDDLVKNQDETDTDCGGLKCAKCADGKTCLVRSDCVGDVCTAAKKCITPSCNDGLITPPKTDVDCGGPNCPRCADGEMCGVAGDCTSGVCADLGAGKRCQPPSYTDGIKNGNETDVDCGGDPTLTYLCATGLNCLVNNDCSHLGCDYNKKCAAGRSCTTHYGGDTCGSGGAGGIGAQSWESCCTTLPVTTAAGGTVYMDKYPVTSGRMRAFLETVGYDVRTAVQTLRAAGQIPAIPLTASNALDGVNPVLDASWDPFLPTSFGGNGGEISDCAQAGTCNLPTGECPTSTVCTSDATRQPGIYTAVRNHLGGNIFKNNSQTTTGCYVGGPGTHSFRFPAGMQDGAPPEQPVDVYDTKTLNCVDYLMAQAFCVWDGGRLETFQEWQTAYGAGATPYVGAGLPPPAEPSQRCSASACTPATVNADCGNVAGNPPTYSCVASKCCLSGGDNTYWGCRFPWATDATHPACGLNWPGTSIENSDYKYSYEYPKLGSNDYIVHLTAPGRTAGRGPLGHSDLLGAGYELTSNVTTSAYVDVSPYPPGTTNMGLTSAPTGPLKATYRWTGNGSWEVHSYNRNGGVGNSDLLNKYGKLGARCVKFNAN